MKIETEKNKLQIDGNTIKFDYNIERVIEFQECCVVLLMGEHIPDNNVVAIGYNGEILWNISSIIKFDFAEAYVSLSKEDADMFSVISFNGVKFIVDIKNHKIVKKEITK